MENLKQIVAKNIMELRKSKDLKQIELAEKINYSDKAISKWERAEAIPDVTVLKQIADLFEVTVDYLINEHEEKEQKEVLKRSKRNKLSIVLLSITPAWIIATLVFCLAWIVSKGSLCLWQSFVTAVPVSALVIFIFNCIWGTRKNSFYILTVLLWGILASIYCILIKHNLWILFVIGAPFELSIFWWSHLK